MYKLTKIKMVSECINCVELTIFSKRMDSTALTEKNPATSIMKTDTAVLLLTREMAVIQPLSHNHYIT